MIVCSNCPIVFNPLKNKACPGCGFPAPDLSSITGDETVINEQAPRILDERKRLGLDKLIGKAQAIIINTQNEFFTPSVDELLIRTGFEIDTIFGDMSSSTAVLKHGASPDIIIKTRRKGDNPFRIFNERPKSKMMPDTRLETFLFETPDLDELFKIQKSRGFDFMTDEIQVQRYCRFIQTMPSPFTGNSTGYIQWDDSKRGYESGDALPLELRLSRKEKPFLSNVGPLDHTASRVKAQERTAAVLELMTLTNYDFDFAIYVENLNSITNVMRMKSTDFSMVLTSGITPFTNDTDSGPTEKFTNNFGPRVHHMAFYTENIEETVNSLKSDGMEFLIELVGSPEEGIKQIFSKPSRFTLLVHEYIHRYDGFDGFFTKSNVTKLTKVTGKQ